MMLFNWPHRDLNGLIQNLIQDNPQNKRKIETEKIMREYGMNDNEIKTATKLRAKAVIKKKKTCKD